MSDRLDPQDPAFDREPPTEGSSIKPLRGMRRVLYLAAAGLFFGLSIVGILLPGVPTVPFLLLTSFFLLRSSPALNERLLRSRTFGPVLRDWHRHRGVRRRVKIASCIAVAATVALSLAIVSMSRVATFVTVGLATVGLIVIGRLPTLPD